MPQTDSINAQIAREVFTEWELAVTWDGVLQYWNGEDWSDVPDFEHSLDAAHLAEQELERRGLLSTYIDIIYDQMAFNATSGSLAKREVLWLVFMFSPEERCQLMLKTVRGASERADWLAAHPEGEKNG